jgi:hypothetical protein
MADMYTASALLFSKSEMKMDKKPFQTLLIRLKKPMVFSRGAYAPCTSF